MWSLNDGKLCYKIRIGQNVSNWFHVSIYRQNTTFYNPIPCWSNDKPIQSIVEHLNSIFRPFGKNYGLRNRKPRFTAANFMFPKFCQFYDKNRISKFFLENLLILVASVKQACKRSLHDTRPLRFSRPWLGPTRASCLTQKTLIGYLLQPYIRKNGTRDSVVTNEPWLHDRFKKQAGGWTLVLNRGDVIFEWWQTLLQNKNLSKCIQLISCIYISAKCDNLRPNHLLE